MPQLPTAITLRSMTLADLPLGMRLKSLANWNQLATDWVFLINAGTGGNFVALYQGTEAGTVTTISYPERFSWIGMVLVDPAFRSLGIGTALLKQAIAYAANKGTIRLDATPQGQKLYETLGFKNERELIRLQRTNFTPLPQPIQQVKLLTPAVLARFTLLDNLAFGAERLPVLNYLLNNSPEYGWYLEHDGNITAYCLGRSGSNFEQIGPLVAQQPADARDLLLTALAAAPQKSFILDIMAENTTWLEILLDLGFTRQRPFIRMYHGDLAHPGRPAWQYAIAGPELG
jgi:GNAT superfamily N-acetyltransferase